MRHLTLLPLVALLGACRGQVEDTGDTGPAIQVVDVSTGNTDECDVTDFDTVVLLTLDEQPAGVSVSRCVVAPEGSDYTEACNAYSEWVLVSRDGRSSWTIEATGTVDGVCREDIHYLISYW